MKNEDNMRDKLGKILWYLMIKFETGELTYV